MSSLLLRRSVDASHRPTKMKINSLPSLNQLSLCLESRQPQKMCKNILYRLLRQTCRLQ